MKSSRAHAALRHWFAPARALVQWIYDSGCVICGRECMAALPICSICRRRLPLLGDPLCPVCNHFVPGRQPHRNCLGVEPWPSLLWFSGLFDDGYRPLIHALKYEHQQSIGEFFGRKTGRRLLKTFANCGHPPLIVPVPLHPSRERHRGYNQSAAIARGLARATGFPLAHDQLRRIRRTRDQTRLSPAQRIANVAKAFAVRHPGYFADRQVILVDDVLTTGATIKECTGILYADGAVEVQAMVIALARPIIKTAEKRGGSGDNSSALPQQPIGDAVGV